MDGRGMAVAQASVKQVGQKEVRVRVLMCCAVVSVFVWIHDILVSNGLR